MQGTALVVCQVIAFIIGNKADHGPLRELSRFVENNPVARVKYDRRSRPAPRSPRAAPAVMLQRLCGPLHGLLACGIARHAEPGVIELFLNPDETAQGGMITISMRVPVRCPDCVDATDKPCARCASKGTLDEPYSAWLAVRPGAEEGDMLVPSALLPGMIHPLSFRIR